MFTPSAEVGPRFASLRERDYIAPDYLRNHWKPFTFGRRAHQLVEDRMAVGQQARHRRAKPKVH